MLALQFLKTQRNLLSKCYLFKPNNFSPVLRNISTSPRWMSVTHNPNNLDKYLLVWMKKYPSVKDVPNTVSPAVMEKARNLARIKICIYLMVLTAVIYVGMIYSGKQAAKRGESVTKMHNAWVQEQKDKK
ncbi:hypothetical protein JTE90_006066 [Oedothorax gibbosus]|uniref:Uncharacterized protein n=1 Tax=Oedothorax gibbosus TaxID=931172 RepID=A0AAV6V487_9ARAC|nr:hypothetical protein JTE90_006066 [Oedothorax gibbosus]